MYEDLTVCRVKHRGIDYHDVRLTNAYMMSMRRSLVRVNEPEKTADSKTDKGVMYHV